MPAEEPHFLFCQCQPVYLGVAHKGGGTIQHQHIGNAFLLHQLTQGAKIIPQVHRHDLFVIRCGKGQQGIGIAVLQHQQAGAIFRSAAALNVDAVLLTAAGSDPLYRRAARVSMGNVFLVPWTYLPEGESWPELLHELGFKTVALALRDDSLALNDPRLLAEPKLAMVLGTEGDGLASSTIAACDYTVKIPMSHGVDSLNVAAASAVAFYQLALLNG